jgi:hypothetical protein
VIIPKYFFLSKRFLSPFFALSLTTIIALLFIYNNNIKDYNPNEFKTGQQHVLSIRTLASKHPATKVPISVVSTVSPTKSLPLRNVYLG